MTIAAFYLPPTLRAQIEREARAAFPRECCGLIEGVWEDSRAVAIALHPSRNQSVEPDRFEIDPADQFQLLRALRGSGRAVIGCYHSHPNGNAEPSERDRQGIVEEGFIWAIAACDGKGCHISAFAKRGTSIAPLQMHEMFGRFSSGPVA